jgi:hypothetical protein
VLCENPVDVAVTVKVVEGEVELVATANTIPMLVELETETPDGSVPYDHVMSPVYRAV